jgi:hypothetical protein
VRADGGSEVTELYRRGGRLAPPADGRLAGRIAQLRRERPA